MTQVLKLKTKQCSGVPMIGSGSIQSHETTEALRAAQFRFDRRLHDLRSEFIAREQGLQQEYLAEVTEISAAAD